MEGGITLASHRSDQYVFVILFNFHLLKTPPDFPHVTTEDQMNEGYWMPRGTLIFTNTG